MTPLAAAFTSLLRAPDARPLPLRTLADAERHSWRSLEGALTGPLECAEWWESGPCQGAEAPVGPLWVHDASGRARAVTVLGRRRINGVPRLVLAGQAGSHEPMDLLALDDDAMHELARRLIGLGRAVRLGRVPAGSAALAAVRRAARGRGLLRVLPVAPAPYIALDDSWAEPAERLSARRRADLRRARRRAEAIGAVEVQIARPAPHEVDLLLAEAMAIEARSWKGRAGTALLTEPALGDLMRRYAHALAVRGSLQVAILRIGGEGAAMQMIVRRGAGAWVMKIGYDERFARCSPGMLLLEATVADAAAAGLERFDLMGVQEPWIAAWTGLRREMVRVDVYPRTASGLAALVADVAALAVRRLAGSTDAARGLMRRARRGAGGAVRAAAHLAARRYVAGPTVAHALAAAGRVDQGHGIAVGFWDGPDDTAEGCLDENLTALAALASRPSGDYLSIKLPALGPDPERLDRLAGAALAAGRRIHFDALAPDTADATRVRIDALVAARPELDPGVTLPGRWARSVEDAAWAAGHGLRVRVVKGQWPDPGGDPADLRSAYMAVVEALARPGQRVSIATHDHELAARAITALRAADADVDLELLYGLPMHGCLSGARELGVPVRIYVPYGRAYLPYALGRLRSSPRTGLWLARDLAASVLGRLRPGRG